MREVPVPRALRTAPAAVSWAGVRNRLDGASTWRRALASRPDLEGAIAGDGLYLFQARPITTLGTCACVGSFVS